MKITKEQQKALLKKWIQNDQGLSFLDFRRKVDQGFDCIMIYWSGMWLGIEKDGYTHS